MQQLVKEYSIADSQPQSEFGPKLGCLIS
uniref:Uncharacterized protein n=1 Tax=Rhizophora mucronata TaxID=61149 RepID=A0A2P2N3F9_RHIMU